MLNDCRSVRMHQRTVRLWLLSFGACCHPFTTKPSVRLNVMCRPQRASAQQMIALCCCLLLLCPSAMGKIRSQQLLLWANIWFAIKLGQSFNRGLKTSRKSPQDPGPKRYVITAVIRERELKDHRSHSEECLPMFKLWLCQVRIVRNKTFVYFSLMRLELWSEESKNWDSPQSSLRVPGRCTHIHAAGCLLIVCQSWKEKEKVILTKSWVKD